MAHEFDNKGKAPFKCVGYTKYEGQGTGCDHCGTGIKHVFRIRSSDGKEFNVGSSCVEKTGEKGLYDEAKRIKRQTIAAAKHAAREALIETEHQAQRERNGGLTDYELKRKNEKNALRISMDLLYPYAQELRDGKGGFCDSIAAEYLFKGFIPTGRALIITLEMLAKKQGRKGSKAYKDAHAKLSKIFSEIP